MTGGFIQWKQFGGGSYRSEPMCEKGLGTVSLIAIVSERSYMCVFTVSIYNKKKSCKSHCKVREFTALHISRPIIATHIFSLTNKRNAPIFSWF